MNDRNGVTLRTYEYNGHLISEVEFTIGDPGEYPRAIGYMVGKDDGRSTLYPTPQKAITASRGAATATLNDPHPAEQPKEKPE